MAESNRILFMGREWASMDTVTRILEAVGCTVTGTVSDAVAIDLAGRSEEHTSELQSRTNLVCRLLLEKKNQPPF